MCVTIERVASHSNESHDMYTHSQLTHYHLITTTENTLLLIHCKHENSCRLTLADLEAHIAAEHTGLYWKVADLQARHNRALLSWFQQTAALILPFINYTQVAISAAFHYFKSCVVFLTLLYYRDSIAVISVFFIIGSVIKHDLFGRRKAQILTQMITVLSNMV